MKKNKMFNELADDSKNKRLIGGETTGLFNLAEMKYKWANDLYQAMVGNFWTPEKVSGLMDDAIQYKTLTDNERRAYDGVISFLVFLDSLQAVNIPNIASFITSSEITMLLAIQQYQEVIHSKSYETILDTVTPKGRREEIAYFWKDDEVLLERIKYIGDIYQRFSDDSSDENFFETIIANYLLEGIYFYNGFAYFDTLTANNKMVATGRMISYIKRDELTHLTLFSQIIKIIKIENPEMYNEKLIIDMTKKSVAQEIEWTNHIVGDGVSGFSKYGTEQFTKHLANKRMQSIGIDPIYPDITKNPYKHLDHMDDNNTEKTNFFESTVVNYTQATSMNGTWDF